MMRQAIERCFADRAVRAIVIDPLASNVAAPAFTAASSSKKSDVVFSAKTIVRFTASLETCTEALDCCFQLEGVAQREMKHFLPMLVLAGVNGS